MKGDITIRIPEPKWDSELANVVLHLEKLRSKVLIGEVPFHIFDQLKNIFQILETLGSARIEGNNTTLSDYVERIIDRKINKNKEEEHTEVANLENAIRFIEGHTNENTVISRAYVSDLHKIITKGLTPPAQGEGSNYPGDLRPHNVKIKNSKHEPPESVLLKDYFDEFLKFINAKYPEQYQLLMVAVAHHRFAYIHPFDNGNGRMGRLLNYALLIKSGFRVKTGRIINPSSVFYTDRDKYYKMLSKADSLDDSSVLEWSTYFLKGLKNEIEKIDSLLSKNYVRDQILLPALDIALERKLIIDSEYKILKFLVSKPEMAMKAEELDQFGIEKSLQKSRVMQKLKKKNMIAPIKINGRIYTIHFANNYLLRGIIDILTQKGYVSNFLNKI